MRTNITGMVLFGDDFDDSPMSTNMKLKDPVRSIHVYLYIF
jgi:hypothetical protein